MAMGGVLGDERLLDVRHELVGPFHVAVDRGEVGAVVAGERQHLDAGDLLLLWLPIVRVLAQLERLCGESGHLRVGAGSDRLRSW